jgi:peptidoglycan/LPS O-acetylase OafA/YrhL
MPWDGAAAVDLFFVLSGFVLALPFVGDDGKPVRCGTFVFRRLLRILPAYWFSLAVALALRYGAFDPGGLAELHAGFRSYWSGPPESFLDHLTLFGWWSDTNRINPVMRIDGAIGSINPVIWSLVVELRMSFVFPLLLPLIAGVRTVRLALLSVVVVALVGHAVPFLWALPLFVFGGLIAQFRSRLGSLRSVLGPVGMVGAWALAVALCDVRFSIPGLRTTFAMWHYLSGAGAALVIALIVSGSGVVFLSSRPVAFLGRISYSFYLLHFPILLTAASLSPLVTPWGTAAWAMVAAVALAATVLLAWFSQAFVEAPGQRAGKWLETRLHRVRRAGPADGARAAPLL